ncbi:MAG: dynamin family protein [Chromatiaceae bacterium]|nr:dynamin family protein [Chromatiaceae bacterium]
MARLFATVFDKIDRLNAIHDAYGKHDFYNQLELATDRSSLNALAQQVDGIQLRVSIIGEFSSGKSTFINAILRKDILPAAYRPTTNQVMQIEHDNETESVVIENQPNSARPLTKEAISTLAKESDTRLLIRTRIPTPMDRFTLFDTPGVNDPAMLSEEVIFDLLGESDIIVFLMRADNALKQTETEFIKKLVLKKDLDKFFFVINFSDNLTNPNEAKELKAYVVRGIANLVEWPRA